MSLIRRASNHEFLIPGEHPFDWVGYLHAMRAAGYDGYVTAEVAYMVQRRPGYDPLAAAAQTYQTLEQASKDAGMR